MTGDGRPTPAWRHAALDARRSRLAAVLALTGGFMVVEVAGGWWTGSLALLADAGHMLGDVGSLTLGLLAVWFASRPPTPAQSYGYFRLEILAALVNALVLLAVAALILYEAVQRLWAPPPVAAGPMLAIAVAGLAVNLVGLRVLHRAGDGGLLLHVAWLELLSDALGSAAVIVAGLVIQLTGFLLADPLVSLVVGVFIVPRTWNVLRQAVHVLMEGVPPHLDLREIEGAMREAHGVRAVHDLHVWTLTSGTDAMSAHVLVDDLADGRHILGDLQHLLRERFGIEHTTIQLETDRSPVLQIGRAGEGGPRRP